jgi:hypothetical protein
MELSNGERVKKQFLHFNCFPPLIDSALLPTGISKEFVAWDKHARKVREAHFSLL